MQSENADKMCWQQGKLGYICVPNVFFPIFSINLIEKAEKMARKLAEAYTQVAKVVRYD